MMIAITDKIVPLKETDERASKLDLPIIKEDKREV